MDVERPKKAIITASGLGLPFLPLTMAYPVEMIPIYDKPAIHYVVEEAVNANIEEIYLIVDKHRDAVKLYFQIFERFANYSRGNKESDEKKYYEIGKDILSSEKKLKDNFELPSSAFKIEKTNKKSDEANEKTIKIFCENHEEQDGFAGAILSVKDKFMGSEDPFIIITANTIMEMKNDLNCINDMIRAYNRYKSPIVSVRNVQPQHVGYYDTIKGSKIGNNIYKLSEIEENPEIQEAHSSLALTGRYIFNNKIFNYILSSKSNNEKYSLPIAMSNMIEEENSEKIYAQRFFGGFFNIVSYPAILRASAKFLLDDKKTEKDTITILKKALKSNNEKNTRD
jgi:UTP--glucose-1-phosphate uridylyltransferase